MALTPQQQNFVSELMNLGEVVLQQRATAQNLVSRWNLNSLSGSMSDGDVALIFPHLTTTEIASAVTALQEVLVALGDDVTGQATNLIKLKG